MKFDPDAVTVQHPANGDEKYLCSWRTPRDGEHAKFWTQASLALAHIGNLGDTLKDLRANPRLSEPAKLADSKEAALRALNELGQVQRKLSGATEALQAERAKLAAVKPYDGDAAAAILDVAIGQHLRNLSGPEREKATASLLGGADQRMVEAVLRLPTVLHGLAHETLEAISARAIQREHPEAVHDHKQLMQSARTAADVVLKAGRMVQEAVPLDVRELAQAFGANWNELANVRRDAQAIDAITRHYAPADASQGVE